MQNISIWIFAVTNAFFFYKFFDEGNNFLINYCNKRFVWIGMVNT